MAYSMYVEVGVRPTTKYDAILALEGSRGDKIAQVKAQGARSADGVLAVRRRGERDGNEESPSAWPRGGCAVLAREGSRGDKIVSDEAEGCARADSVLDVR